MTARKKSNGRKSRRKVHKNVSKRYVWRMRILAFTIIVLFFVLGGRLFQLQIVDGQKYAQIARRQHIRKVKLESRRGSIVDRAGQEIALDHPQYFTCGVRPAQLKSAGTLCTELAAFTSRPASHYQRRLQSHSPFVYLEWRLTASQADRLQSLGMNGMNLKKTSGRFYPFYRATSQLLGYTDVDGSGIAGLEVQCDEALQGEKGWEIHQRDARGVSIWDPLRSYAQPRDGGTVRLSIDILSQEILHDALIQVQEKYQANWAGGVLLNPKTGEILAISSVPDFDPIRPEIGPLANHKLKPITDLFEPGSVFKVVAATAALEKGIVCLDDSIFCENGSYRIGRKRLKDTHEYGWLTFEDVIVYSSNIGMAKVAEKLGSKEIYRFAARYGFGTPTGIDFPGENSGRLRPYDKWKDIDRANIAMGQGIAANMLQLALAFGAIANDGILMEPRLVLDRTDMKGNHRSYPPREVRRVMEPETARQLRQVLIKCVDEGTGKNAALDGSAVAGKTGTAQVPDLIKGGYYDDRFVSSFAGFITDGKEDRLLVITVCEPQEEHFASQVAAPVFKKVMQRLQPADVIRKTWKPNPIELADVSGGIGKMVSLPDRNIDLKWLRGPALSDISELAREDESIEQTEVLLPDLRGISIREATRILTSYGITVEIDGSGWIVKQSFKPGTSLIKCSTCRLKAKPL
ncbi:hypothetical protein CEE37_02670 [candidate division LCP-89 bacterium B3_LCP]|uniref:PASTA domain-containing protein n=1 Tax=candidate division LCP-89 bacterium B3_LCP TaxID=2012998 RepID=A0A532V2R8_UNCL8|nr:MAG: hypothetical protein CEE37_02670 [candidate division LCP-89 bacterium B3_LCP]